jgi:AcrR family transcriptional regulator
VGGARYQHKLETLAALRAAALQLALHQGLETITATDIATAAGVSRRTFFNYFASKEDALVGETPQLATFLREAITTRPAAEPPLTAVQTALLETAAAYITNDVRDRIRTRHHTPPRIEPGLLATLIAGTARWCTHQWAEHGDPPLTQRLDTALSSLRTGLG